jgi:large subunit ribosomal protein L23
MSLDSTQILVKPIVSEKSYLESDMNKYRFVVANSANKIQIRQAVEELFGVKVKSVNVSNMHGKNKRFGRFTSKKADWKKAVVTLNDGESIDFFERFENV